MKFNQNTVNNATRILLILIATLSIVLGMYSVLKTANWKVAILFVTLGIVSFHTAVEL